MFLPIGDTPNPRNFTPWVNWALIAVNVAVYLFITVPLSSQHVDPSNPLLQEYINAIAHRLPSWDALRQVIGSISAYDLVTFAYGYKPGAPGIGDLFTSMFLHGGFLHLAGNMLFLWIHGDNVEHRLGRLGYLAAYLGTGVVATLTFALFAGDSMVPMVGASGAISGVLGLYFVFFPRNKVKVFVFLFPFLFDVFLLPVRWVLGFFVVVDNLLPLLINTQSSVAYGAHLGGFFAGAALAMAGQSLSWRWPWSDRRFKPRRSSRAGAAAGLAALKRAVADGDRSRAIEAVGSLGQAEVAALDPGECVLLAEWLADSGHHSAGTSLLRRCLVAHQGSGDLARVYLALGILRLRQGQPTAAYQHLLSVFDFDPDPETAARAREALDTIDVYKRRRRH